MTSQVTDIVYYKEHKYGLCKCSSDPLFEPRDYGLNPKPPSTACYRGWMAKFLASDTLALRDLLVFHDKGLPVMNRAANGPPIAGIMPNQTDSWCGFNCEYKNLNLSVQLSGGIIIARKIIPALIKNTVHYPFWKFEEVRELSFSEGNLVSDVDKSHVANTVRNDYLVNGFLNHVQVVDDEAVKLWIEKSFQFRYVS